MRFAMDKSFTKAQAHMEQEPLHPGRIFVLSKSKVHVQTNHTQTLHPAIDGKKISAKPSSVMGKIDETQKTASETQQISSQTYKKYLEEMEFKIRYIKNDIEFKQEQMRKRKLQDVSLSDAEQYPTQQNSKIAKTKSNRTIIAPPREGKTMSSRRTVYVNLGKSVPHSTVQSIPNILTKGSNSCCPGKRLVGKEGIRDSTWNPLNSVKCAQLIPLESDSVPVHSRSATALQTGLCHTSELSKKAPTIPVSEHCLSQNKRIVIYPSKIKRNEKQPIHVLNDRIVKESAKDNNSMEAKISLTVHPIPASNSSLYSNCAMISSRTSERSPSKYKYLAPQSTVRSISKMGSSCCVSCPKSLKSSSNSSGSDSIRTVLCRQTSSETRSKRITPLKVKAAFKLVSKYKMQRLSPTSGSKVPPRFCSMPSVGSQRGEISSINHIPSRVNLFKLDKRKLKILAPNNSHETSVNHSLPNRSSLPHHKITNIRDGRLAHRKSKTRFSVKYSSQPYSQDFSKQNNIVFASTSKALGHSRNSHCWMSVDAKAKILKVNLAARRQAALACFRLKSSKSVTDLPSKFKWSHRQDSKYGRKHGILYLQRPFPCLKPHNYKMMPPRLGVWPRPARLIMIGGVVYRSSPSSLKRATFVKGKHSSPFNQRQTNEKTKKHFNIKGLKHQNLKLIHLRGVQYHIDSRGKRLCRVHGSVTKKAGISSAAGSSGMSLKHIKTKLEKVSADIHKKAAASRVLQRSLAFVAAKHRKDNRLKKGKQRYCLFFCRFGKCHRGDACPYTHDREKVVICTRFLRGKCDIANCLFSHNASAHKMPVCLYYLQGLCSHEDCLYLHVKVSCDAPPCKDFLHGYCSLGKKCKKLHSFLCPSFAVYGKCHKGDKCLLLHRRSNKSNCKVRRLKSSQFVSSNEVGQREGGKNSLELSTHEEDASSALSLAVAKEVMTVAIKGRMEAGEGMMTPEGKMVDKGEVVTKEQVTTSIKEGEISYGLNNSPPLKSQPSFISLSPKAPSHGSTACKRLFTVGSLNDSKTKIKPDFSPSSVEGHVNDRQKSLSHVNRVSGNSPACHGQCKVQTKEDDKNEIHTKSTKGGHGFINLSLPSTDPISIQVESSDVCSGSSSNKSGLSLSQDTQKVVDFHLQKEGGLKSASPKAVLFKGIIPNFLPSSSTPISGKSPSP